MQPNKSEETGDMYSPDDQGEYVPEIDQIEGLSVRMTQAMNHYQQEECHCFVCCAMDHFAWNCPHRETFQAWHKEHLNSKGAGPQKRKPAPANLSQE